MVPAPTIAPTTASTTAPVATTAVPLSPTAAAAAAGAAQGKALWAYVFNFASKDVTIVDVAKNTVVATRPLGAAVQWLSSEQRYYDGANIWTHDFSVNNKVRAIAVDPKEITIVKSVDTGGNGPSHSLMLTPDFKTAYVNVAGSDLVSVIDTGAGQATDKIATGKFPCDFHCTEDAKFGYVPERDQDTVSKIDMTTRKVVKTVDFPKGSKPYMLRVSPDGKEVWVQTGGVNTNNILDPDTLEIKETVPVGKGPVTNAWSPDGKYVILILNGETYVEVYDARTRKSVKQVQVGQGPADVSFTPDGKFVYVCVPGTNSLAAIDMTSLTVAAQIPVGKMPHGVIIMPAVT